MEEEKIINPLTGRSILVGGPTYNRLIDKGFVPNRSSEQYKFPKRQQMINLTTAFGDNISLRNWEEEIRTLRDADEIIAPSAINMTINTNNYDSYSFYIDSVDPQGFTRSDLIYQSIKNLVDLGYNVDNSSKVIDGISYVMDTIVPTNMYTITLK